MAGLEIANEEYKQKFKNCLNTAGIHNPGYFAVPAFLAAYTQGDLWLSQIRCYLAKNRQWVIEQCQRYFPQWSITQSDGTYTLWINYQRIPLTESQLKQWFLHLVEIEVSWGTSFGSVGNGFFHINLQHLVRY
ncbi:MAG: hypothetical protein AB8W37_03005 [Arsenophonus endosymbiont of Dermacentor nuttalli]